MFYHIFGPRGSGGYDYRSGGVFCRFLIVLILLMDANVVISAAGDDRQRPGEQDKKNGTKKNGVCLIVFGGLFAGRFIWLFYRRRNGKTGWPS